MGGESGDQQKCIFYFGIVHDSLTLAITYLHIFCTSIQYFSSGDIFVHKSFVRLSLNSCSAFLSRSVCSPPCSQSAQNFFLILLSFSRSSLNLLFLILCFRLLHFHSTMAFHSSSTFIKVKIILNSIKILIMISLLKRLSSATLP